MTDTTADDNVRLVTPKTHGGFFGHLGPNRRFIINLGPNFGFGLFRDEKKK